MFGFKKTMQVGKNLCVIAVVLNLGACSSMPYSKYAQNAYLQNAQHNLAYCRSKPSSLQCRKGIQNSLHYEAWYNRQNDLSHLQYVKSGNTTNSPLKSNRVQINHTQTNKLNTNHSVSTGHGKINDSIAIKKQHHALNVELLELLYNGKNADVLFLKRIPDIDTRADFFNLNHAYFQSTGMPVRWFAASEHISRRCLFGLGADGCFSHITFTVAKNTTHPQLYEWRQAVGDAILQQGFVHFKQLYNQSKSLQGSPFQYNPANQPQQKNVLSVNNNLYQAGWSTFGYRFKHMPTNPKAFAWDMAQLKREQAIAQPLHQQYLTQPATFVNIAKSLTGVNLLKQQARMNFGCKLMGYTDYDC